MSEADDELLIEVKLRVGPAVAGLVGRIGNNGVRLLLLAARLLDLAEAEVEDKMCWSALFESAFLIDRVSELNDLQMEIELLIKEAKGRA